MKTIDFSPDLKIPVSVTTQKLAFLGISGSGKTYGAGKLVEGVIDAGGQVVIVDSIGNWFGLRLDADGKRPGIAIPVLGGDRGDVALDPTAGKQTAELVVETGASLIIDVSDFGVAEGRRFVTAFATNLLALKKKRPSPVLVVWEECQDFVPQRVMGEAAHCLGAMERLIKKGRNYGVGTVLISQRAAAVNKDVLNQIETLFCFRLNASQDRDAIKKWIVENGVDVVELLAELPKLPTGTAFCWSPEFMGVLKKVKVGKKWTFDASATPEFGKDAAKAGALGAIELAQFKHKMAQAIETAKANDPVELKKKIAEQSKEIGRKNAEIFIAKTQADQREREFAAERARVVPTPLVGELLGPVYDLLDTLEGAVSSARTELKKNAQGIKRNGSNVAVKTGRVSYSTAPGFAALTPGEHTASIKSVKKNGNGVHVLLNPTEPSNGLVGGARRMLQVLAQRAHDDTSIVQLATLAGMSHKSGTFKTYMARLNVLGFIHRGGKRVAITPAGLTAAGIVPPQPTGEALLEEWCGKLTGGAKLMLRVLAAQREDGCTKSYIAEQVEMSEVSGTFKTYMAKLNSNGLIEKREDGRVRAVEELWS